MATPQFTPAGGKGSTWTDPKTGTSYRFEGGTKWTQISTGGLSKKPSTPTPPQKTREDGGGGGGGGEGELEQLAKTDRNPVQESRYQELLRQLPSLTESVPSAEEEARRAAEEKARIVAERNRRYQELVGTEAGNVEAFMRGRPDISSLFQQELEKQGISGKEKILSGLEKRQLELEGRLTPELGETYSPIAKGEIAPRRERGMLTAAAERRLADVAERPFRQESLEVGRQKEMERVGLQRAYDLVDKYLDYLREQEKRAFEPVEFRLGQAKEQFGVEEEGFKSQIDSIAERLSGFNEDRKAKLAEYEMKVDAGIQLYRDEQAEMADLRKIEFQHLKTMEEIAAKRQGRNVSDFTEAEVADTKAAVREALRTGVDPNQVLQDYAAVLTPEVLNKIVADEASLTRNISTLRGGSATGGTGGTGGKLPFPKSLMLGG